MPTSTILDIKYGMKTSPKTSRTINRGLKTANIQYFFISGSSFFKFIPPVLKLIFLYGPM